jgi:hypothetical protein
MSQRFGVYSVGPALLTAKIRIAAQFQPYQL